jgi:RsiW-degrading membrane proteinase PrsW (M82 family)
LSTGRDLTQKAYLAPSIITVSFVVALFLAVGHSIVFNLLLAGYLALAAYYFVYQLCGKRKPWWILVCAALGTIAVLRSPVLPLSILLFRHVLPGQVPENGESIDFLVLLIRMFFGAGLMEELLKVLPLGILLIAGRLVPFPWDRRIGIWEPLDGILLGAASAVGFTLLETLGQYVPDIIQHTTLQVGEGLNELAGLQLLIPRLLGSIAGHMAYSGYFGYFIGLSVLKPRQSVVILTIGYLTAAGLHALWNAMGSVSPIILALVGILSYAFLAAAILKARSLSPTRSQNFATRLRG